MAIVPTRGGMQMKKTIKNLSIQIFLVVMLLLGFLPKSAVVHATPSEATLSAEYTKNINYLLAVWNTGSNVKVKNLVKADVPSDLMTSSLRYKYETISTPDSPVRAYMWHDMSAVGQYTDTVYFGTDVPGATIYTNENSASFLVDPYLERIWDSANPSTPYFFNTSRTKDFSRFNLLPFTTKTGNQRVVDLLDVSNAEKLDGLFSDWNKKLAEIGYDMSAVRTWNTSKVKSLVDLFRADGHHSVDFDTDMISNWDVHNVTDVSGMYQVNGSSGPNTPLTMAWNNGFMNFDNLEKADYLFTTGGYGTVGKINYDLNFTNWNFSKVQEAYYHTSVYKGRVTVGKHPFFADKTTTILDRLFNNKELYNSSYERVYAPDRYVKKVDDGSVYYLHNVDSSDSAFNEWLGFDNSLAHQVETGTISDPSGTYEKFDKDANHLTIEVSYTDDDGYSHSAVERYYDDSLVGTSYTLPSGANALNPNPSFDSSTYTNMGFPWKLSSVSPESAYTIGTTFAEGGSINLPANGKLELTRTDATKQITYDLDGGTNAPGNPTVHNATYSVINDPTKSGKVFIAWKMTNDNDGSETILYSHPYNTTYLPNTNVHLKAIWGTARNITIHGNGATEYYSGAADQTITVGIPDNPSDVPGQNMPLFFIYRNYPIDTIGSSPGSGKSYYREVGKNRDEPIYWNYPGKVLTGISNTNHSGCKLYLDPSQSDKMQMDYCGGYNLANGNEAYLIWEDMQYMPQFDFDPRYGAGVDSVLYYSKIDTTVSVPNYSNGNRGDISTDYYRFGIFLSSDLSNARYAFTKNDHPTFSIEGYETGASDEFIINKYAKYDYLRQIYGMVTDFDVYMGGTKLASNVKTYTFSSGITGKPRLVMHYSDEKFIQYNNLDETEIETFKYSKTGVVPYTYRSTLPPHGQYNGFDVLPIGWTLGKQYKGTDHEGIYVSTGSLPTLYRGSVADLNTAISNTFRSLVLYPLYSVDINRDGIADLFQNKNTFTISKALDAPYFDLTSISGFTYNVFLGDVNGDPIKNWTITDTDGNSHTTDNSGIIHLTLHGGESVSLNGILPNMIVWAKETTTGGLIAEHQISYNGTAWVSGADSGNITYQDNTPLTVAFKNTDTRVIVPAGVIDNRTKRLTALMIITILVGLAGFAIIKRVTDRLQM